MTIEKLNCQQQSNKGMKKKKNN